MALETHTDERGTIRDLLVEPIDSVTIIDTRRGKVRGNHWHEQTWQWMYMLRGLLLYKTRIDGVEELTTLKPGDFVCAEPGTVHAWRALSDADCMVFTRGPRAGAGYESDTFRLAADDWLLR